ncbi:response regulator [Uliginosibacterium gangwonense]|uniref:response regulator n=1 Tax=Uliginosibacterium gangwonense TaxID=392736 RepID=UPI000376C117|nr:response regulator [Uliginosibacterium gangwonense]
MNSTEPRVLIVDDEQDMRELLCDLIESAGLHAFAVEDGAGMRHELAGGEYSLLILDLRLRREDGLTLARAVRQHSSIPIMILTGKGDETDRILGLELAADDYLMKPFNPRELLARVRALLRRAGELAPGTSARKPTTPHEVAHFGGWTLDFTTRVLQDAQHQHCTLTPSEFSLLETLVKNANRVLTRDQLLEHMRGEHTEVFDRTIDVLILRLRRKIEPNPEHPGFIRTERGMGYIFTAPVEHE